MVSMFPSHRMVALPEAQATMATHAVVHSAYRIHVVDRERVLVDDALALRGFDRVGAKGRPVATILLQGRALLRVRGEPHWLEPGEMSVVAVKGDIVMRQEPPYASVVCEWEPGPLGERPEAPFHRQRVAPDRLTAIAALAASHRARAAAEESGAPDAFLVVDTWTALREAGVPVAAAGPDALVEPVREPFLRLARALDAAHSNLHGAPMSVDLEAALGLSARQVNRLVQDFNERYGFNSTGWRDTRNRWRLLVGASLLTAPGATAEAVARAVGFASGATFSRALTNAGFPPPGEIPAAVRALV
jgi:hypothetical protein